MLLLCRHLAVTSSSAAAVPSITLLLHHRYQQNATFVDVKPRYIRDRGLDHAVEKEKHLRPFHALKDLLLLQNCNNPNSTSTSLPLASISENRNLICFPFRSIDFVRCFPSAFLELPPPDKNSQQPIISPTDELVRLQGEEMSIYDSCKAEAADRLLRLIMLTRHKKEGMEGSGDCNIRGVPTYGGKYVKYIVYGNLFEVSAKYVPPIRPISRSLWVCVCCSEFSNS